MTAQQACETLKLVRCQCQPEIESGTMWLRNGQLHGGTTPYEWFSFIPSTSFR
jgi:hypothetical protein